MSLRGCKSIASPFFWPVLLGGADAVWLWRECASAGKSSHATGQRSAQSFRPVHIDCEIFKLHTVWVSPFILCLLHTCLSHNGCLSIHIYFQFQNAEYTIHNSETTVSASDLYIWAQWNVHFIFLYKSHYYLINCYYQLIMYNFTCFCFGVEYY